MSDPREWSEAQDILCVRLDSLGDVLMTMPAIRALKETWPACRITLLTSHSGAAIAALIPEIDDAIVYDPPWMKHSAKPANPGSEFQMIHQLKQRNFDAAVIFTSFSQSALPTAFLTFLSEVPLRLAYCRENPYYLLTDWVPETDEFGKADIRHEVHRQLDLVAFIGCRTTDDRLSLRVPPSSFEKVQQLLAEMGLDTRQPWIILHPGATAASRRYPEEGFRRVAQRLICSHGFQIVLTGTAPEIGLVEGIRRNIKAGAFSLAGKLEIAELSALIAMAPLLITNNTGPAHIAAALGTPLVDLYALTNPQHTPWKVPHRILYQDVPCKFCYKSICPMGHHDCLRLVTPEAVVEATLDLLGAKAQ